MNAKYRFIDRKGRLTIPYALRVKHGITQNTLFAVRENDDGTLSLRQQYYVAISGEGYTSFDSFIKIADLTTSRISIRQTSLMRKAPTSPATIASRSP